MNLKFTLTFLYFLNKFHFNFDFSLLFNKVSQKKILYSRKKNICHLYDTPAFVYVKLRCFADR